VEGKENQRQSVYRLEVSPAANRDLTKLGQRIQVYDFECLRTAIDNLANQPRPSGGRKIKGEDNAYRIRVGDYRIVYEIYDNENTVVLLQVVRRSETTYG